jgi:excisionase family DNA binding protein
MQNVFLSSIPIEDLKEVFRDCLKSELELCNRSSTQPSDELITEQEARQLLKISKVTLKKWRDAKKIPFYRYGSRIRYKKNELLDCAEPFLMKARRVVAL